MRRLAHLLLPLAAFTLTACGTASMNLDFEVFPDKSGGMERTTLAVQAADPAEQALWGGMQVKTDEQVRLARTTAAFEAIDKLNVGGVTFKMEEQGQGWQVVATIPAGEKAEWVAKLVPSEAELARVQKALARGLTSPDGMAIPTAGAVEQLNFAVISLQMPGDITGSTVDGAKWRTQVGREKNFMLGGGEKSKKDTTWLWIPIHELRDGKIAEVTWSVTCGVLTPARKFAWEQAIHKRDVTAEEKKREERLREVAGKLAGGAQVMFGRGQDKVEGVAWVRTMGVKDTDGLRGPATAPQFCGDEESAVAVIVCEEPGEGFRGIYGITLKGEVVWLKKGAPEYEAALAKTK